MSYSIVMQLRVEDEGYKMFKSHGLNSYEMFLETKNLSCFYIITTPSDNEHIKQIISSSKIPFKCIEVSSHSMLSTLNIAHIIQDEVYLAVDNRMYLTQPLTYSDLYHDGKIKYNIETYNHTDCASQMYAYTHTPQQWLKSCEILNANTDLVINISCCISNLVGIFKRDTVLQLMVLLFQTYQRDVLCKIVNEDDVSIYTLYWVYVLQSGLLHEYLGTNVYPIWRNIVPRYGPIIDHIKDSFIKPHSYFHWIHQYDENISNVINKYINRPIIPAMFMVSSAIDSVYTSTYTRTERFEQTIQTALSIKKYSPRSIAILIDASDLSEDELTKLRSVYTAILNDPLKQSIGKYTTYLYNKGIGEGALLYTFIDCALGEILELYRPLYVFKLGGRYRLNENFKLSTYDIIKYNFGDTFDATKQLCYYNTGLYSIPMNSIHDFSAILKRAIVIMESTKPIQTSIEYVLTMLIDRNKVNRIAEKKLGLYCIPAVGLMEFHH